MKKLMIALPLVVLAGCAQWDAFWTPERLDRMERRVDAAAMLVEQANEEGIDWFQAPEERLRYYRLLCAAALLEVQTREPERAELVNKTCDTVLKAAREREVE